MEVLSAGAMAGEGSPATPEAIRAVEPLGIALAGHASRPLTRELLQRADVIFALTRAHVDAITRIDPTAADRIYLLDPAGADVPDPIGRPQPVYDETARTLEQLIGLRLGEFGLLADNAHRKESP